MTNQAHLVFALSGKIGSGKTTISNALAQTLGCPLVSFGEFLRKEAIQRNIEPSRQNLQVLGQAFIEEGWFSFCELVLAQNPQQNTTFVIDGIRHVKALETLQAILKPLKVYHIHLSIDENRRSQQLLNRGDSFNSLEERHISETQVVEQLPSVAGLVIYTEDYSNPTEIVQAIIKKSQIFLSK